MTPVTQFLPRKREVGDWIGALAGIHRRRTYVGVTFLTVVLVLVIAGAILPQWLLSGGENTTLAPPFDGLLSVVIFLGLFVNGAALAYALWNGGPGLSFAIPLIPLAAGWVFTGQVTVAVDLALALASGTAGGALATARVCRHVAVTGDQQQVRAIPGGLALTTAGSILTAVVLWRVASAAGPHATSGVLAAGVLLAGAVVILVVLLGLLGVVDARAEAAGIESNSDYPGRRNP